MKNKNEFKGWDWTELFQLFPDLQEEYDRRVDGPEFIRYPEPGNWLEAEKEIAEELSSRIFCYSWNYTKEATTAFIKQLRIFLKMVARQSGYYKPYFKGILKIKEPDVFLHIFARNVTYMWT